MTKFDVPEMPHGSPCRVDNSRRDKAASDEIGKSDTAGTAASCGESKWLGFAGAELAKPLPPLAGFFLLQLSFDSPLLGR